MKKIALLRGVTPTGKNRIPKMCYLAEILEDAGFEQVQTYIQSGNIIFHTELSDADTKERIHQVIWKKIGADLSVILKETLQLEAAIQENPFQDGYDKTRVHLVFTNDEIDQIKLCTLRDTAFNGEEFQIGTECLYMYLPRCAEKKVLSTNFLEKQLGITTTMRKLSVITHLCSM